MEVNKFIEQIQQEAKDHKFTHVFTDMYGNCDFYINYKDESPFPNEYYYCMYSHSGWDKSEKQMLEPSDDFKLIEGKDYAIIKVKIRFTYIEDGNDKPLRCLANIHPIEKLPEWLEIDWFEDFDAIPIELLSLKKEHCPVY